jgi:subfamily B ATP-binding cassette protein MsbA
VGESGSGKSTLVDLLTATLKPTSGRVTADGRSLADVDVESLRRRIGFVSQESVTFDDTVANNITLWQGGDPAAVRLAAERAHCAEFIERMPGGYDAVIGDRGVKLSGGQRQRLAIARELYKQPEILILDEATSALDSESEQAIQASIDGLKGQMTIIIVAHRLSTIRRADRIFVLEAGRLVEQGAYQELLSRPGSRFRRMCELQQLTDSAAAG